MANPDKLYVYGTSISDMMRRNEKNDPYGLPEPTDPILKGRVYHPQEQVWVFKDGRNQLTYLPPHYEVSGDVPCSANISNGSQNVLDTNGKSIVLPSYWIMS